MTIDTNELRRKVNSTDIVDHIDLHANIKPFLSELLDRLEAAEKERDALRAKIEQQKPVAWMSSRNGFICKENKNPDYNVPLYALPGAKGEGK